MYKNPWYVEMTSVMQKIQEAAQKLEDEKWENKRKPAIDELTKPLYTTYYVIIGTFSAWKVASFCQNKERSAISVF